MNTLMTIADIKSRFNSEWVLVEDPQTDEALQVLGGKVLYHHQNRDEFDRHALEYKPRRFAVIFTGEAPDGMEYVL